MTTARTLGVEGAQAAALGGGDGVLDKARFVERVGVDRHLHVHGFGHVQAVADGRRCRTPVLVQLQADDAGLDLLLQRRRKAGVALAQKAQVHREGVGGLQHALDVPWTWRAGGSEGARGGARAAAHHGGHPAGQRFFDLLRADEVDVRIDAAGGDDVPLAADDLGARADDDVDAALHVRVARLADGHDTPALEADVGLHDAPVVQDQRVGHDAIHRAFGARALRLRHAVADRLAAAELDFLAVAAGAQRVVLLDLDQQVGVG